MRIKNKLKVDQNKKSRMQILRSWMTSFAVTAVAAVIVVTTIPASPIAEINQIQEFQNAITFQVNVTDSDQALYPDSLEIVLENQMEYYSYPLTLGLNVGIFEDLPENTEYTMRVVGNKGYGNEHLTSMTVKTQARTGGSIVSYTLIPTSEEYYLDYDIRVLISDPHHEYIETSLYYAFIYEGEHGELQYTQVPVAQGESNILIESIPNYNMKVHIYLEAILANDEKLILDELYFYTPLNIEPSLYITQITDTKIVFTLYPAYLDIDDLVYHLDVIEKNRIVSTKNISASYDDTSGEFNGILIEFTGLKRETDYTVALRATYTNPFTLIKETIDLRQMEFRTSGSFTYTVDVIESEFDYRVTVTLVDPSHNYQLAYYRIIIIEDGLEYLYESNSTGFIPDGETKSATFVISKDYPIPYRIEIGVRDDTDYYYTSIIHMIEVEE